MVGILESFRKLTSLVHNPKYDLEDKVAQTTKGQAVLDCGTVKGIATQHPSFWAALGHCAF